MSDNSEAGSQKSLESKSRIAVAQKVQREFVTEFVDASTKIAVRVQRTSGFRPYYSMVVGRFVEHENGETFVPYIPVRAEIEFAKVKNVQDHSKLLVNLIKDATDWIGDKLQQREDEIIVHQQEREKMSITREKGPASRPGIKQLGKIDRIAKHYV